MTNYNLNNLEFTFLPEKAIYIKQLSCILLSDLHLGKEAHFRKNGIPLPNNTEQETLWRLGGVIEKFTPKNVFILGDLFHSEYNESWDIFNDFLQNYLSTKFILVLGNHDILPSFLYKNANLSVCSQYSLTSFELSHHPLNDSSAFNICGHIHPGVILSGSARQKISLPCFYLQKNRLILPAFGAFTGKFFVKVLEGELAFVIAQNKVLPFKAEPKKKQFYGN